MAIGQAVLSAYIREKEKEFDEKEKTILLKERIASAGIELELNPDYGGVLHLRKEDVIKNQSVENLFYTRHSVRGFADAPVDFDKLERAVNLALSAPSACNRQATQIYVISGENHVKAGGNNDYHAYSYLIITGNMRAYALSELNDWIVTSAIFSGFLSLALHAEGIGTCIMRKDIVQASKYNDNIRSICNIPEDEQIILEMAIGNLKDEFYVPVSRRRKAEEIIHYIS